MHTSLARSLAEPSNALAVIKAVGERRSATMTGLDEEIDALLERLGLSKYKKVMEENEVSGVSCQELAQS